MKSNPLIGPVTIPRRAHRGMSVLPWAQDVNRAIQQLRDRKAPSGGSGFPPDGRLPMFWVTITKAPVSPATAYEIRVEPGLIAETLTITENKPITRHHPVPVVPAETPAPLEISNGEVVFLTYETDKLGAYKTDTADIVVASDDAYDDTNRSYPPAPAAVEGTEGARAVKLARLDVVNGTAEITQIWRGPWRHWQDLPTLRNKAVGDAQVYAGFDSATGKYDFRALKALSGINIAQNENDIDIGISGDSFNILIRYYSYDFSEESLDISSNGVFAYVRNGLLYLDSTKVPLVNGQADFDADNVAGAGTKYDRLVIYQPNPALYFDLPSIIPVPENP